MSRWRRGKLRSGILDCSPASLLAISKEDIDSELDDLHSVLSIPSDRDSPVQLFHLSFHDFLLGFKDGFGLTRL